MDELTSIIVSGLAGEARWQIQIGVKVLAYSARGFRQGSLSRTTAIPRFFDLDSSVIGEVSDTLDSG